MSSVFRDVIRFIYDFGGCYSFGGLQLGWAPVKTVKLTKWVTGLFSRCQGRVLLYLGLRCASLWPKHCPLLRTLSHSCCPHSPKRFLFIHLSSPDRLLGTRSSSAPIVREYILRPPERPETLIVPNPIYTMFFLYL
jgi:hypothetical protein